MINLLREWHLTFFICSWGGHKEHFREVYTKSLQSCWLSLFLCCEKVLMQKRLMEPRLTMEFIFVRIQINGA